MTVLAMCLIAGLVFLALSWKLDREAALAFRNWMVLASWGGWRGGEARRYRQSSICDTLASGAALLALVFLIIAVLCGLAIL